MGERDCQEGWKDIDDEVVQGPVIEHRYLLPRLAQRHQARLRRLLPSNFRKGRRGEETEWCVTAQSAIFRLLTVVFPPAKLAISIARKLNALIFLVPEGEY